MESQKKPFNHGDIPESRTDRPEIKPIKKSRNELPEEHFVICAKDYFTFRSNKKANI